MAIKIQHVFVSSHSGSPLQIVQIKSTIIVAIVVVIVSDYISIKSITSLLSCLQSGAEPKRQTLLDQPLHPDPQAAAPLKPAQSTPKLPILLSLSLRPSVKKWRVLHPQDNLIPPLQSQKLRCWKNMESREIQEENQDLHTSHQRARGGHG